MNGCGRSTCSVCKFFSDCQDCAGIAKSGIQVKELKGVGSANKVFALSIEEMPDLSLVARFSLPETGSYAGYDFDSLEESIWNKYGLKVDRNAQSKAAGKIEYVGKIVSPLLGAKYIPPQVSCYL